MTNRPKDRGRRAEHRVVAFHTAIGVPATRVPGSGMFGGALRDDVELPYGRGEVKLRTGATGWKTLKAWMKTCQALFLLEPRTDPLVVLSWAVYAELVASKYGAKDGAA